MATASWAADVRTVVDGHWFAEGSRWHDGLWCSDIHGHRVLRIDMRALRGGRTQPSLCARERDRSCDPFRIRQQKSETDITNRY